MPEEEKYEIEYGQGISDDEYCDPKTVGKKKRPFGLRNSEALIENRVQRLYKRQLEGLTCRQLVLDHAERSKSPSPPPGATGKKSKPSTTRTSNWNAKQWRAAFSRCATVFTTLP